MDSHTIYTIGECMVEFSRIRGDEYRRSFGGDVYNTAVYLGRLAPSHCNIEFVSAIGDDAMSAAMKEAWREEGLSSTHVAILPGRSPGLYIIDTDETGERHFSYWRSQSAARDLTVSLERLGSDAFQRGDFIYYSGITLAILRGEQREILYEFVRTARLRGAVVAFDPNFRPALWESHDAAVEATMKAYGLADIVLTGADEQAGLFDWRSEDSGLDELERLGVREAIVKAGERGIFGTSNGQRFHIPFTPADQVVDTTAAGDSFVGAYLAFRLRSGSPEEATDLASRVARIVVASRGAIVDRDLFASQLCRDRLLSGALGLEN